MNILEGDADGKEYTRLITLLIQNLRKGSNELLLQLKRRKRCCSRVKKGWIRQGSGRTGQYQTDAPDDVNVVCRHASGHGAPTYRFRMQSPEHSSSGSSEQILSSEWKMEG